MVARSAAIVPRLRPTGVGARRTRTRVVGDPGGLVEVFTDGACRGNPGPGGWGVLLRFRGHERTLSGAEPQTTNNRMELMAAIHALETLTRPCRVRLVTDSEYVKNGITRWIDGWRERGWRTASRKPVKNADLWQRLDAAARRHRVRWEWTRGHSGHPENERVDALARSAIETLDVGAVSAVRDGSG